ncbi:MAG: YtxH domain-containing protein [Cyanobacteria bacterium REEB67]|nr:YtxH domain-containing protein [Cyanobacteria bacterium REEB67]
MSRFFEGLVVGGVLGYVVGILSAPKSGEELRQQIADNSEDIYKQASDSLGDIREKTGQVVSDVSTKGNEVLKKAGDSVQGGKDKLTHRLQELAGQSTKVLVDDVESATSGG